jgi:hypothetical protein
VNFSAEGGDYVEREEKAIEKMLDLGVKMVVAAGNGHEEVHFYPAVLDRRIVVVGNLNREYIMEPSSNFGSFVNRWEIGEYICAGGKCMTGTSQATATATGKILNEMLNERKRQNATQRNSVRN